MPRKPRPKPPAELFDVSKIEPLKPFLSSVTLKREAVESFDVYPFNLPAVRELSALPLHPKITFFVGENGSGKSTLLEAIAVALEINPEGGSKNFKFATRESHSVLHQFIEFERGSFNFRKPGDLFFLRAESFFNVATEVDRLGATDSYGGTSLHEQSHGEAFFALIDRRFHGDGIYLLDEPEAALSPARQMSLLAILHRHISDGSQFIIATHSPIIMAYPDAYIYSFGEKGTRRVEYEETEHFRITRDFLTRREKMLEILLSDEDS